MNQTLQIILGSIASIGIFIGGIGYFIGTLRKGRNGAKIDAITLLKADVDELTKEVVGLRGQVTKLESVVKEKDDTLGEWLKILQGKDPRTETIMNMMKEYIEIGKPLLDELKIEVIPVVKKLDLYLNKQTF